MITGLLHYAKFKRLSYAFTLVGTDGLTAFYGEHGIYP